MEDAEIFFTKTPILSQLREWKTALEEGLITGEEFTQVKANLITAATTTQANINTKPPLENNNNTTQIKSNGLTNSSSSSSSTTTSLQKHSSPGMAFGMAGYGGHRVIPMGRNSVSSSSATTSSTQEKDDNLEEKKLEEEFVHNKKSVPRLSHRILYGWKDFLTVLKNNDSRRDQPRHFLESGGYGAFDSPWVLVSSISK